MGSLNLDKIDNELSDYEDSMEFIRWNIWRMKCDKKSNKEIYGWFEGLFYEDFIEASRQIDLVIKFIERNMDLETNCTGDKS